MSVISEMPYIMSKQPERNQIWAHVQAIGICMMVTRDAVAVRARPMRGIPRPEQNTIWFFADRESQTDEDVRQNPSVCLTYTDVKDNVYVSLSGRVMRVPEADTINDLWDEHAEAYFQDGRAIPASCCRGSSRIPECTGPRRPTRSFWPSNLLRRNCLVSAQRWHQRPHLAALRGL
jgi:general stress protein 26